MHEPYVREGGERLVNTSTTGDQQDPRVAALKGGGFIVCWEDGNASAGDGSSASVKARLFDAAGNPISPEIVVNTATYLAQLSPAVTALASGGFLVTWTDRSGVGGDSSGSGIKGQMFDAAGVKVGAEFLVNTSTDHDQWRPVIAALELGGFVVAWSGGTDVYAQIFDASGAKLGSELLVHTKTLETQSQAAIAALADGGFVVTWVDQNHGWWFGSEVKAQVFDASGARRGGELLANSIQAGEQWGPSIAALVSGGFVISWTDGSRPYPAGSSIKAQIFDAGGMRTGFELLLSPPNENSYHRPTVTGLPDGNFTAAWWLRGGEGSTSHWDITMQLFSPSGAAIGNSFSVNTTIPGDQRLTGVETLASGGLVAVWTDFSALGADTSGTAVKAQVFAPWAPIQGTAESDVVAGTSDGDVIYGHGGNDSLDGASSNDTLDGGDGADTLKAARGATPTSTAARPNRPAPRWTRSGASTRATGSTLP